MTNHRFETLDAMRGAAASSVVFYHVYLILSLTRPNIVSILFSRGYLAVDLFFIMSGFVIAFAYERRLLNGLRFSTFFVTRTIRLAPMAALGTVLGLISLILGAEFSEDATKQFLLQIAFIPNFWHPTSVYPLNGVEWSLFFEFMINLVYAVLLRRLSNLVLIFLILVSAAGLFVVAYDLGSVHGGWSPKNFLAGIPRSSFGFFLGVLMFRTWMRYGARLVHLSWLYATAATLIVISLASIPVAHWKWYYDVGTVIIAFPPLIWLGACSSMSPRLRWLGSALGNLSYPIYAIHWPVMAICNLCITAFGYSEVSWATKSSVMILCILVAAWTSLKIYDEPVRAMLARRLVSQNQLSPRHRVDASGSRQ